MVQRTPFEYPEVTLLCQGEALTAAGLSIDTADEWQGTMEFMDAEALVTYLSLVPWDAPRFTVDAHLERLADLDSRRPIRVTQRRFRIHAIKREGCGRRGEHDVSSGSPPRSGSS